MLAKQRLPPVGCGDLWRCKTECADGAHWEIYVARALVAAVDPAVGEKKSAGALGLDSRKG